MTSKKTERLPIRMNKTLYNFLDNQAKRMSEEVGEHISKSEVARRILNVYLYLTIDPNTDITAITNYASEFEDFLKEKYEGEDVKEELVLD